ncbi:MAG: RNA polymerase sigma factor [Thermoanaerobaculia bacterium]
MPRDPSADAPLRLAWSRERERTRLTEASESELLAAVQRGDEAAFDVLVERTTPDLVRWAARYLGDVDEARDVVQAVFLKVWRRRRHYDPERAGGRSWLLSIATNMAIDRLRRVRRRQRVHAQVAELHCVPPPAAAERWSAGEVERLFRELARGLSPRQQAAFLLREVEDHPTGYVAEVLRCSPSTVRSLVSQARTALKGELGRRFPEYLPPAHPGIRDQVSGVGGEE